MQLLLLTQLCSVELLINTFNLCCHPLTLTNIEILKGVIPLSMTHITNQIVCVCAVLANFQPTLVSLPTEFSESVVEDYFEQLTDSETDSDSDTD